MDVSSTAVCSLTSLLAFIFFGTTTYLVYVMNIFQYLSKLEKELLSFDSAHSIGVVRINGILFYSTV